MSDKKKGGFVIRTKKFMSNRLLARKQMIIDVVHPGKSGVSHAELKQALKEKFKVRDANTIITFGMRLHFGGGRSTGFALIYDSIEDAVDTEPRYRLVRAGLGVVKGGGRQLRRQTKNKNKKLRKSKIKKSSA